MRTLSATLSAAQKVMGKALYKAVFTKSGQATKTYGCDTANRILNMSHTETEWAQTANIIVDDRDGTLTTLNLIGYTCTISYGYNTSGGDEYSACAPLEVVSQKTDTLLKNGDLVTSFYCNGVFDLMSADKASVAYTQEDDDTQTVKTLLTAIAGATLPCFSHCKSYTITFDSEDSLIDSYIPADYFRVSAGESRLSAFRKLIRTTKCKARIENTAGVATIHVSNPTISGTSYDYEYNDAVSNHNFFEKNVRKRVIIPNKILVSSHPSHTTTYSGNATDSDSYNALGRYINSEPHYIRATSDAQCTAIATAILQQLQVESERGSGYAPMNCGQEVLDYVKITDSIASDTRTGNVGYIARKCSPGKSFSMEFRFGRLSAEMPFMSMAGGNEAFMTWEAWDKLVSYIDQKDNDLLNFILDLDTVPRWNVTEDLSIPTPSYTLE